MCIDALISLFCVMFSNWEGTPMGSILRFLALAGVISVGSYMLYQAESRLSESESLTQMAEEQQAQVSLGESSDDVLVLLDESEAGYAPQSFSSTVLVEPSRTREITEDEEESLLERGNQFRTAPLLANLDEETNPAATPELPASPEFPASEVTTAERMVSENAPAGAIRLASDESPFGEDLDKETIDEFPELKPIDDRPADSNPFGESPKTPQDDPFGEFVPLETAEPPTEQTPTELPKLDVPFPEEFPDLEKEESDSPDPFGEAPPGLPEPTAPVKSAPELDPFAPLPTAPTAKPMEAPIKSADPFESSSETSKPDAFGSFNESKPKSPELPIITPLRTSEDPPEAISGSFKLPKITPKPIAEPAPFTTDDRLPVIGSNRSAPTPEPNPFATDQRNSGVAPASAEESLPIVTPKKADAEATPFPSSPFERKAPAEFPESFDSKPTPAPTQLEEAFPLPEPLPIRSFEETEPLKTPAPSADAFPALEPEPAVKTPPVENPFGEPEPPAKPVEEPLDDSFEFPPLPRATANEAPPNLNTPAEEFPEFDLAERPTIDETPKPTPVAPTSNEVEAKPLPESPIPSIDNLVPAPNEFPELPSDSDLGNLDQPGVPKEFKETGISKPIEPRSVPLPQLVIEKLAPDKAVLQQPFVYHIVVKNMGNTPVSQVTVQDQVPRGTKLTGTIPQAELTGQRLLWKLDRMLPGEEKKISVRVIPEQAGPIGSVATVNFVAEVGAETLIELPKIDFRMILPPDARVGEVVSCRFDIENKGDQTITGLVLREILPEGFYHPSGRDLENPLGDLKPGDRIIEQLQLKVMKAGEIVNTAYLGAEGGLRLEATARLNAKPSRLTITRRGPKQRLVGRMAIYHNLIKNVSGKPVSGAMVVEQLPQGMEFVSANEEGEFHEQGRTIFWKLPTMQPNQTIVLQSKVIPHEQGTQESLVRVIESSASKNEIQAISHTVVQPVEALGIAMSEHQQPVMIGDSVIMTIEATNRGERIAENVRIRATIPPALHLMNVRGETRFRIEGREVVFEPLNELVPGNKETIQLELKAAASSQANVGVTIQSNKMTQPIQKASSLSVQNALR